MNDLEFYLNLGHLSFINYKFIKYVWISNIDCKSFTDIYIETNRLLSFICKGDKIRIHYESFEAYLNQPILIYIHVLKLKLKWQVVFPK